MVLGEEGGEMGTMEVGWKGERWAGRQDEDPFQDTLRVLCVDRIKM